MPTKEKPVVTFDLPNGEIDWRYLDKIKPAKDEIPKRRKRRKNS